MKDNYVSAESAAVLANAFSAYLDCPDDDLTCLRSKSVEAVMEAAFYAYLPARGDYLDMQYWWYGVVPQTEDFPFADIFSALPPINSVPALNGVTWNEALSLFLPLSEEDKSNKEVYKQTLEYLSTGVSPDDQLPGAFSDRAQALYDAYPFELNSAFATYYPLGYDGYEEGTTNANYLLAMMYHDISYYCANRHFNQMRLSTEETAPAIYTYLFSQVTTCSCSNYPSNCLYTTHGDDLAFIATSLITKCPGTASAEDLDTSLRFRSALVNFIHTGNPNTGPMASTIGPVSWPRYTIDDDQIIEVRSTSQMLSSFRADVCSFWDSRGYFHGFNNGDPYF